MIKVLLILFFGLACEAVGFAFLGRGMKAIKPLLSDPSLAEI